MEGRPDETTPLIATLAHSQSLNTFVANADGGAFLNPSFSFD
jgi:hypothetical protein